MPTGDAVAVLPAELRQDVLRSVAAGLNSVHTIAGFDGDLGDAVARALSLMLVD